MGLTMRFRAKLVLLVCGLSVSAVAQEVLPLEEYAKLPEIGLVAISPSGNRVAMRSVVDGMDGIAVLDLQSGEFVASADSTKVDPVRLRFINDEHLFLITNSTRRSARVRGPYSRNTAFHLDIAKSRIRRPLEDAQNIYEYQGGIGRIVGQSEDGNSLYMPAYIGERSGQPTYGFYRVDLDRRKPRQQSRGSTETIDWYLNVDGSPLLREDYDNRRNLHQLWRFDGDKKSLLYEDTVEQRELNFVGLSEDRKSVVFRQSVEQFDVDKYFSMDIASGEVSGPIFDRGAIDVDHVFTDANRIVVGVRYSGFLPRYKFFDERMNQRILAIQNRFVGMSVSLVGWSDDREKLVFYVTGPLSSGVYLLFQGDDSQPASLGFSRPNVSRDHIAPVLISEYKARDGLSIPSLVTAKPDVYEAGDAPLIVMPHGGPASRDGYGFHWMAQYFASRGYVVLQPQFRGSVGFGLAHEEAGFGEWGGKMQTDLDDGVDHLVRQGVADPDRVCMIGGSYGGYAALAAGAFTPDKYRCIVSFAGVSDLPRMLLDEKRDHGADHWVVSYWKEQFGGGSVDEKLLRSISPYYHADRFEAPVLLIHGRNDTVVPREQSERMARALRAANKQVEYVALKGEDHDWGDGEQRQESLELVAKFVEEHL